MNNKHLGTSFEAFLEEEELYDEAEAVAVKRVIAYEIEKEMKDKHMSKVELAKKMDTSRSSLERLLDPENTSVSLKTLVKATHALGRNLIVSLA